MAFAWNVAEAQRYHDAGGEVLLWRPMPTILVTRVTGHVEVAVPQFYAMHAERAMPAGRLRVFHDWSGLTGYTPAARNELKRWAKQHTPDFTGVHYLVRSKVLTMLISVAALSMGRDLDATTDRAAFLRLLAAALHD